MQISRGAGCLMQFRSADLKRSSKWGVGTPIPIEYENKLFYGDESMGDQDPQQRFRLNRWEEPCANIQGVGRLTQFQSVGLKYPSNWGVGTLINYFTEMRVWVVNPLNKDSGWIDEGNLVQIFKG